MPSLPPSSLWPSHASLLSSPAPGGAFDDVQEDGASALPGALIDWLKAPTPGLAMGVASEVRLDTTVRDYATMETALLDNLASRENPSMVMTPAYDGSFDAQIALRGPYSGPTDELWVHRAVDKDRWDAVAAWFDLGGVLTTDEHQPLAARIWRRVLSPLNDPAYSAPALTLMDVLRERMLNASATIYRKEIVGTLKALVQRDADASPARAESQRRAMACQAWVTGLLDARPLHGAALGVDETPGIAPAVREAIQAHLIAAEQRLLHAVGTERASVEANPGQPVPAMPRARRL